MSDLPTFEMFRGDDRTLSVDLSETGGGAIDLTGAAVRFTGKVNTQDADDDALIVKTVGDGITIADPPTGEIAIDIAASDTSSFAGKVDLVCDVQISVGGKTRTVWLGRLTVLPDVSRTSP